MAYVRLYKCNSLTNFDLRVIDKQEREIFDYKNF